MGILDVLELLAACAERPSLAPALVNFEATVRDAVLAKVFQERAAVYGQGFDKGVDVGIRKGMRMQREAPAQKRKTTKRAPKKMEAGHAVD